jgi:hypothetical protein
MRKSIITLGLIAAGLVVGMIPGVAAAQDGSGAPPAAAPPPDPTAPSGNIAKVGTTESGAPALSGISVFGVLGYGYYYAAAAVGVGGRYMLPVPIPSLLKRTRLKDSWAVEFGADLLHWSDGPYSETDLHPVGDIMWNVWLTPVFAVYPKAGVATHFVLSGGHTYSYIYYDAAVGLIYQLSNAIALRAEAGNSSLRGGVSFWF